MTTEQSLKADFADLGVSIGYVGNLTRTYDDRSFRVFTSLEYKNGNSVSIELPAPFAQLDEQQIARVVRRLEQVRVDLATGQVRGPGGRFAGLFDRRYYAQVGEQIEVDGAVVAVEGIEAQGIRVRYQFRRDGRLVGVDATDPKVRRF